jgi:hypothetical protein
VASTPTQADQPSGPALALGQAQWSPWSGSPARSGVSSHNNASPPGGVIIIDADNDKYDNDDFYWD